MISVIVVLISLSFGVTSISALRSYFRADIRSIPGSVASSNTAVQKLGPHFSEPTYEAQNFVLLATLIPGPRLSSITNLPRLLIAKSWRAHEAHIALHKKHGSLVRLGPNCVSIADPALIPTIYGINSGYVKSGFYPVMQNFSAGRAIQSMFNTTDETLHRQLKRPVAHAYAMSTLKEFEPFVDSTTSLLLQKLAEKYADTGTECDLGQWLHWYAFDVIGELTFSKRLGFLEEERDIGGVMKNITESLDYASVVGQMPWLDHLLYKNRLVNYLFSSTTYLVTFALQRIEEKHRRPADVAWKPQDFLSRFLDAKLKKGLPDWFVVSWSSTNVAAGSDTTAISLRAVFYYLLKHPTTLVKLKKEVDAAQLCSPIKWDDANKLPYLQACIKEAMRLHPAVGLPLERIVPEGGLRINGRCIRPGTIVGMNAWVVQRDKGVYGSDADLWRPERWMEGNAEQKVQMERAILAFGSGQRSCIGKNISLLEMYKLIPQLLKELEIELVDPEKNWTLINSWFVRQEGLNVRLRRRI